MTHIRRLEVKCLNDNDSRNGVVSFMAVLDDGARVPGRLTPTSGRAPLGSKYKVYLRKIN
jgi:hypothetical protein